MTSSNTAIQSGAAMRSGRFRTGSCRARRGVSQVCLALWASTIGACVGLIYYGTRAAVFTAAAPAPRSDPFVWACLATGVFGFYYNLLFAHRVWTRYSQAPSAIREPLAYAIVSLADSRRIVALALPVIVLTAKTCTAEEQALLHARARTVLQKQGLERDGLLQEVRAALLAYRATTEEG